MSVPSQEGSDAVMIADALTVAATLASLSFLVPQLARLVRTSDPAGVSPAMAAIGLVSCVGWALYGLWDRRPAVVLLGVVGALEYVAFCTLLGRAGKAARVLRAVAWWTAVLAVVAVVPRVMGERGGVGTDALGAVLDLMVVAQYWPAVTEARQSRTASGVAVGTWLLVVVTGALWYTFGAVVGDLALGLYGAVLVVAAVAVIAAVCPGPPERRSRAALSHRRKTGS